MRIAYLSTVAAAALALSLAGGLAQAGGGGAGGGGGGAWRRAVLRRLPEAAARSAAARARPAAAAREPAARRSLASPRAAARAKAEPGAPEPEPSRAGLVVSRAVRASRPAEPGSRAALGSKAVPGSSVRGATRPARAGQGGAGQQRQGQGAGQQGGQSAGQQGGGRPNISSEQRTTIRNTVVNNSSAKVTAASLGGVSVGVGVVLPAAVNFVALPPVLIDLYPQYRSYRYIVVDEQIVIVDPDTRRIVEVVVL